MKSRVPAGPSPGDPEAAQAHPGDAGISILSHPMSWCSHSPHIHPFGDIPGAFPWLFWDDQLRFGVCLRGRQVSPRFTRQGVSTGSKQRIPHCDSNNNNKKTPLECTDLSVNFRGRKKPLQELGGAAPSAIPGVVEVSELTWHREQNPALAPAWRALGWEDGAAAKEQQEFCRELSKMVFWGDETSWAFPEILGNCVLGFWNFHRHLFPSILTMLHF